MTLGPKGSIPILEQESMQHLLCSSNLPLGKVLGESVGSSDTLAAKSAAKDHQDARPFFYNSLVAQLRINILLLMLA